MKFEKFVAMMDAVVKKYPSIVKKTPTEGDNIRYDRCFQNEAMRCSVYIDADGNISNEQTQNSVVFTIWGTGV